MEKAINKQELKKHVATIHCSNTLTLLQRKISNALLYNAYHKLMQQEEHEITIKKLCALIGYNSNDHLSVKNALKHLISTVIEWNVIDESNEEDWTASSILASARIKGPLCYYAYSPRMKELLHSPAIYGRINLIVQARFKSNYGLAVYENCVRYRSLSYTRWFELAVFRNLMGIADNLYPIFRDLKRRVIDKAVEEVNTYSDIFITPEVKRAGRKVVAIRFHLKERAKKIRLGDSLDHKNDSNHESLSQELRADFGFTAKQVETALEKYDVQVIQDKMALVKSSNSYIRSKIENLAAYLLSALKNDYQLPLDRFSTINRDIRIKDAAREAELARQKHDEALKQQYTNYVAVIIDESFAKLPSEEQDALEKEFKQSLHGSSNAMILQFYKKDKLDHKVVKVFFQEFLKEHHPQNLPVILSFDDYVATTQNNVQRSVE